MLKKMWGVLQASSFGNIEVCKNNWTKQELRIEERYMGINPESFAQKALRVKY